MRGRAVEAKTQGPALAGEGGRRSLHIHYLLAAVGLREGDPWVGLARRTTRAAVH
jgi:hypothetical protein